MNQVHWKQATVKKVRNFPEEVRKDLGYLIFRLQLGEKLSMPYSKSMPSLGNGCSELRVKGKDEIYRVFYYLKKEGVIYIFHAFKKKTQKTPQKELDQGKKNLKEMLYGQKSNH